MRCFICDVELSELEIQLDEEGKSEPCTTCTTIIFDTAYSDGFTPGNKEDAPVEDPLLEILEEEGFV